MRLGSLISQRWSLKCGAIHPHKTPPETLRHHWAATLPTPHFVHRNEWSPASIPLPPVANHPQCTSRRTSSPVFQVPPVSLAGPPALSHNQTTPRYSQPCTKITSRRRNIVKHPVQPAKISSTI